LRQNLVFADFLTPEINALFNKHFWNVAGKVKIRQKYAGTMLDVIPEIQQLFTRIECASLAEMDDARFKHFVEQVL
jgi:U3 small nucleolar RNA-associated protein 25